MRLSNPEALTAHTVAGDVTGDVRAPPAFAAGLYGADHFLNFTAIGGEANRRSRAKPGAAVISDTGLWAHQQPPNRERRQLPARGTAVDHLDAAEPAAVTLVAGATELRRGSGSEMMQDEILPVRRRRDLDDRHTCVPNCGWLYLRDHDPDAPQCVHIKAAPVTSPMNKGSPSGPL